MNFYNETHWSSFNKFILNDHSCQIQKWQMIKFNNVVQLFDKSAQFYYLSIKTYVVGIRKNHLNETVLLSTHNKCWNLWIRKYSQLKAQKLTFCSSGKMIPSHHTVPGHYRPTSETPSNGVSLAGREWPAIICWQAHPESFVRGGPTLKVFFC